MKYLSQIEIKIYKNLVFVKISVGFIFLFFLNPKENSIKAIQRKKKKKKVGFR
jgi:hypothetical protein